MTIEDLEEGMEVLYVPRHADEDVMHPDCERGTVKRWRDDEGDVTVFVTYDRSGQTQATPLEYLVLP